MLAFSLTARETETLSAILCDHLTQRECARQMGVSRALVRRRLRRAVKKLASEGFDIALPGRGRRPRLRYVDPVVIGQAKIGDDLSGGCRIGTLNPLRRRSRDRADIE